MVLSSTTQNHYRPNKDPLKTRDLTQRVGVGIGNGLTGLNDEDRHNYNAANPDCRIELSETIAAKLQQRLNW
ncbi:hypothetical protein Taro_012403, partial [Colocasia esculenta]|nr:hypothetical protein [Colocasia esculenta]